MKEKFQHIMNNLLKLVGLLTLILLLAQFLVFLEKTNYYNYFNIDMSMYTFNSFIDLSTFGCNVLVFSYFLLTSYLGEYIYEKLFENSKNNWKVVLAKILSVLIILLISSILIFITFNLNNFYKIKLTTTLKSILFLSFIILGLSVLIHVIRKDIKDEDANGTASSQHILTVTIILFLMGLLIVVGDKIGYTNAKNQKIFKIVNQNEVVIYNTNDYAIVESAEIKDNEIIIDTSKSKKISLDEIEIERRAFDKVTIKR